MLEEHGARRRSHLGAPSGRAVGNLFACALAFLGLWAAFVESGVLWPALIGAGAMALCAFVWPELLVPLARTWMSIGAALHRVFSPILIAVLFVAAVVPMSLIYRILRRDRMKRRYDPSAPTYWVSRSAKAASSWTKQF
jgi:hypothetical protein